MTLLLSSLTIGLILSLLGLGVYVSFRIFDFADITTDGSFTLGAAVAAILLTGGTPPILATLAGTLAGGAAGAVTGLLHTRLKVHPLLSGILVMTALYSVNLRVMGKSNVPILSVRSFSSEAEALGQRVFRADSFSLAGWEVSSRDAALLLLSAAALLLVSVALYLFLQTELGAAMRATGDNAQMIRALGAGTAGMITAGLALANALVALSGALLAQYQGFADVQMGIGMVVWGLASVILGEALVRSRRVSLTIAGAVMGSVLFRLLVALALRWGLDPNDLKLVTAAFVLAALVLPRFLSRGRRGEEA